LTGITLEITQRKQMEQRLRDQVEEISLLREQLEQENTLLRAEAGLNQERHHSLGISSSMQRVKVLVEQVASNREHSPYSRGNRHRQGTDRPGYPSAQRPKQAADDHGQLCGLTGGAH
jgi:FtsZ-binding cell division protein ZapB